MNVAGTDQGLCLTVDFIVISFETLHSNTRKVITHHVKKLQQLLIERVVIEVRPPVHGMFLLLIYSNF